MQEEPSPQVTIDEHIKTKLQTLIEDKDTASGHIRHEQGIRNDYMGRAPFELLQNAIDRAEAKVVLSLCRDTATFSVSNDGQPFSFQKSKDETRSDFAALCAVNASNKTAGKSIGNKGVGFRSIWQFCKKVKIESRLNKDGKNVWGFRLYFPFDQNCLALWENKEQTIKIIEGMNQLPGDEQGKAPSFYFPEHISEATLLDPSIVTSITLEDLTEQGMDELEKLLYKISSSPLIFGSYVSVKQRNNTKIFADFYINNQISSVSLSPNEMHYHIVCVDTKDEISAEGELLLELDYHLSNSPQLYLAIPKNKNDTYGGFYHCYLPTEMKTGCLLHIHGDFFADSNRKKINFETNKYNRKLLNLAAKKLLDEIHENHHIFSLSTLCDILMPEGVLEIELKSLLNDGNKLASLVSQFLSRDEKPNFTEINSIYRLIKYYIPVRSYYNKLIPDESKLGNYFACFARDDIKIVPLTGISDSNNEEVPICAELPKFNNNKSSRLFCHAENSNLDSINAAGVVVTRWRFPSSVESHLKKLQIWTEYSNSEAVIAALSQSQHSNKDTAQRESLLKGVVKLSSHVNDTKTNWRFSGKQLHPTQRVLIPAISPSGWARVSNCYFESELLNEITLDTKIFFKVDELKAREILGDGFKCQLLYWGVWNGLPLISNSIESPNWKLSKPISEINLAKDLIFKLLTNSFAIWSDSKRFLDEQSIQLSSKYHQQLKSELIKFKWIESLSGELVAPENCFIALKHNRYDALPCLINSNLDSESAKLVRWLDIKPLDDEYQHTKLLRALTLISKKLDHKNHRSISGEYKAVIRQLNEPTIRANIEDDTSIPLLVKDSNRVRIANADEPVFFFSSEERRLIKNYQKLGYLLWDANRDTSVELSKKISGIIRPKLRPYTEPEVMQATIDENAFKVIQNKILPSLFAYAEIADEIHKEPDEEAIRYRWSLVIIRRYSDMKSGFLDSNQKKVNVKELSEERLLSIPHSSLSNDKRSMPAILIIHDNVDLENEKDKELLSGWLAQEIFGMHELTQGFCRVLKNDFELEPRRVIEYEKLISSWLSSEEEEKLIQWLQQVTSSELSEGRWRWIDSYKNQGLSFEQISSAIPNEWRWVIQSLNPREYNIQILQEWLKENARKLKFLLPNKNLTNNNSTHKYSLNLIDFNPAIEVLNYLGVSQNDFDYLDQTNELEMEDLTSDFEVKIPTQTAKNILGAKTVKPNEIKPSGRLFGTLNQSQRNNEAEIKAKNGKSAEIQIAFKFASRCFELTKEDQFKVFDDIKSEFNRLKHVHKLAPEVLAWLNSKINQSIPTNEKEWYEILHVGNIFDGCGYDVIGIDKGNSNIELVEVKRSQSESTPEIFFSENERQQFITLSSQNFRQEHPHTHFKIYLSYGLSNSTDITQTILSAINEHSLAYDKLVRPLTADGWKVSLKVEA